MMPAPQRTQYNEAIQNLRQCISDEELRGGELAVNAFGLPLVWAGGFADVYRVHCPQTGSTWAVKCFVKETPRLRERYREISSYLQQARLPFTVDFQVVQPGLRVGDQWVPILKMRWVEGLSLNQFVSKHLERPKNLRQLLELWPRLATRLHEAGMAHGDLQHGNVLLVPVPETGRLSLKLVDYDGMFVPALAGYRTGEVGHPAYQHPQRLREAIYNAQIDRFSHLAIYTAIQGVIVGGEDLWRRNDNGDNLLFREVDYQNPGLSATLQQLWDLGDAELQALTGHLILAAEGQLEQVPLLDQIITDGQVQRLAAKEQQHVERLLFPARGSRPAPRPPVLVEPAQPVPAEASPQPPAPVGPVVVTCVCGSSFKAAPHLYGKQVPCPVCRAPIDVPRPGVTDLAGDPLADLTPTDDPWTAELPSPAMVSPAPLPRIPKPAPKTEPIAEVGEFLRQNWIPISSVAVGVLAILVLLVVIFSPFRGSPQPLAETARSSASPPVDVSKDVPAATPKMLTNSIGMKLALIPAGKFLMGSPDSDTETGSDEKPQHRVQITEPFYLGVYEVTQAQYQKVVGNNPSKFKDESLPVGTVSWDDAMAFCKRLSEVAEERAAGRTYRLPTEAEWEYACRAGSTSKYSFGDSEAELGTYAWYNKNSNSTTHPVGEKQANAWGLYDMHGNVYEWCQDAYGPYKAGPASDSLGPGSVSGRVFRGGGWSSTAAFCRSAGRFCSSPSLRDIFLGFRLAAETARPSTPPPGDVGKVESGATTAEGKPPTPSLDTASAAGKPAATLEMLTNSIGIKLVLIPSGEFLMGSPDSHSDALPDEKPQHRVQITKPFYLGVYEVSQAQYQKVVGNNPSTFKGESLPVETVSWDDAVAFCKRLSEVAEERAAGRTYRLPTEAEWEYACRAGSTSKYSFGDSEAELEKYAWYDKNSGKRTHPVGEKQANAWGLYDMQGNVWEWCQDRYGPYKEGLAIDPSGPGSASNRLFRGGGWGSTTAVCRSAFRFRYSLSDRSYDVGFRLAAVQSPR